MRCPEGPSIKGPHRIGQSMFPGRPGSRVGRWKPWLRRQAQPRPTLSTQRRTSNDPSGARVRGSVADVDKTHLPLGARPAERQAANLGIAFCGGLLGDDEGPIRSGRQGCEARAGEQTSERARACLHRKVQDRIDGRRPGSNRVIALTRRWLGSSLARWTAGSRRQERRISTPSRDRGRQRSDRPVRLPQPMGAGGPQPPRPRKSRLSCCTGRNGPKLSR